MGEYSASASPRPNIPTLQLDHIHLNLKKFKTYFATSFFNYTSDHHLISLRIAKDGNRFKVSHLEKMSFNVDKETRSEPMSHKRRFPENKKSKENIGKRRKTEKQERDRVRERQCENE